MNFEKLVSTIQTASNHLQQNAIKAVNIHLTMRNWLVGFYIVEYEQNGYDKAKYGEQLLASLAKRIQIKGLGETNLKLCRQFYTVYPEIQQTIASEFKHLIPSSIRQTLSDKFYLPVNESVAIRQTLSDDLGGNDKSDYFQSLVLSGSISAKKNIKNTM